MKSPTQLAAVNVQAVEPPKLQVVAPVNGGVAVVVKVLVPGAGKLMGVTSTVLLPAGMVKAPRFGMDAGLPDALSVPVAVPDV